jgi:hypothetical protein
MPLTNLARTLIVIGSVTGCGHLGSRTNPCPDYQPPSRSAIAWERAIPGRSVSGRVVTVGGEPLADAYVNSSDNRTTLARTGKDGRFHVTDLAPGVRSLRVLRIGYESATVNVEIAADSGARMLAVLERRPITLDGCGYAVTRDRVP